MKILMSVLVLFLALGAQAKHGIMQIQNRVTPKMSMMSKKDNLVYYGGPVISNVRLYTVFWGPKVDSKLKQDMPKFYSAYVSSAQMEWLDQYNTRLQSVSHTEGTNQHIGRGNYGGDFEITPKNTSTNLQDADVQAELEYQIAQNILPKPDENSLYMIHFPMNVKITIEGQSSCSSFCAYHEGFKSKTFGNVFYGVMPDLKSSGCSFSCAMGSSSFNATTYVSSHELVEAVTDPFPTPGSHPAFPQAWNTTGGEEIADVCETSSTLTAGGTVFAITKLWDNSIGACSSATYTNP